MNKSIVTMAMSATVLLGACAQESTQKTPEAPLIGRTEMTIPNGRLTPEVLYSMARVSGGQVSPDGKRVLYGVSFQSIEQNKGNRELFVVDIDGKNKQQITHTPQSENNEVWINGGKQIAFLTGGQIWVMDADGSNRRQISQYDGGIDGFLLSPDETKVAFISQIPYGIDTHKTFPDLPKATGRMVDDLMYKHWDEWVETVPHTYWAPIDWNGTLGAVTDIVEGEPYDVPMKPFAGVEELSWTPDGTQLAYAARKKTGVAKSLSTNSDIYLYDLAKKETRNLTEGMMGYDTNPVFSPDGSKLAWVSQERDGYESDKHRLFVMDMVTGKKTYLTEDFDYNADSPIWHPDGNMLAFLGAKEGLVHIWGITLDKQIGQVTTGQYNYLSIHSAAGQIVAQRQSHEQPTELYRIDPMSGAAMEISFENKPLLDQLTMGKSEPRWVKTTDNKEMLVWVIYPPHFDPNKKYPALLYCQGGPQNMVSQYWSFRWNFQIMAANDYIIVAPNRRGLPGFGQEWLEQISGDYGGQNMKDYLAAIDAVAKEPYVDENHLGAVGASYGGFSVYWLAGNHNKRFKAFIAHAGMFNMEHQYLETEEMWFANWDMGGPYWDKNNPVAQRTFANSPHRFVDKWDTPILVTHGEMDFRVPISQGLAAFNAAKLRGVPAEMLVFPDENHWILQPQNGVLFQRVFFNWLDKWLKE
ncbi:dipeptidyl aminopeptidase/acylaminoacyl peptidase [Parabacteroides sp. PFB2-12]|uniref:S9 family peptidase n=1 Tax=unclassified Parabacteroides TaxID=2649774 RepID=UPI002473D549|nr:MULTISPECIES: S9 family peptidase [unclassified Parabacteroides]MDH6343578.1 dipeptidyl aminopeptidase/acylaminoacyl peptidase [Parabacteroides sp. PM6-13]MDH6391441.1 dipeptidyl aminopeptidase/acylaminoacyl peptidase [Parabacteroides sp. PFB2-12]